MISGQVIPRKLTEILAEFEAKDIDVYAGVMVDRVARDGSLKAVAANAGESLFDQYPVRCALTKDILKAWTTKAIAFRDRCLRPINNNGVLSSADIMSSLRPEVPRYSIINYSF